MTTPKRGLLGGARKPVRIACINRAERSLDVSMAKLTTALQKCYDKHFLPVWGYPVKLYNTDDPKPTDWQLIYLNNPDQRRGLLGRHELTYRGQPISKVFVETVLADDETVSKAASHELFEMVLDPMANLWADKNKRTEYAYEVCDAVEDESFKVNGLEMSNFVYPSWFEPFKHPRGTKFDHLGSLTEPFSMTEGGYIIKRVDGRDIVKAFGSRAKKRRFEAEDRRGHRSEFRDPSGIHLAPRGRKR
ncbi:hypothetical protein JQ596_24635 [Bradyrhizobium manausense]|uniref:hypothetical protein n=1 Tax=Bradyrhizobium TaxID=374 RepID=UPI001BA8DF5F|nr:MULTISPECIES: hypothetical protein [Bradyrhizobium]MBR0828728.1 hypothetical protein [Bradyrhizobium manausense]UVO32568.1 hypothetical protein KUF59_19030 [Bradyrhizobium arachidis]